MEKGVNKREELVKRWNFMSVKLVFQKQPINITLGKSTLSYNFSAVLVPDPQILCGVLLLEVSP